MPAILYPDVPDTAGVPPLLRAPGSTGTQFDTPTLLQADGPSLGADPGFPKWAILNDAGAPAIVPDSMVSVDYAKEWNVSDYPTEAGAFESYNKVERPYELRVTVSKGGLIADRAAFLTAIKTVESSLALYSVVTPERVYENGNLVHVDYRRASSQGAGMIMADLHFQEIRVTATATFSNSNAKSPTAAGPVDAGAVQGQPLTAPQVAAAKPVGGT